MFYRCYLQSNPPTCLSLIPKERTGGRIAHCAGKMDQQEPDKKRAVEDSGRTDDPVTNKAAKTEPDQDVSRRKEIREINRLAARECRARKKRLMAELEKTVSNLTSEHSALMKQNRELTIRLETLQRTVGMGLSGAAAMSNFGQNMAQLGLLNQLQQNKKNSGMQQVS